MKKSQNVNVNIDKYTVAMLLQPYVYNHVSVVECLLLAIKSVFHFLKADGGQLFNHNSCTFSVKERLLCKSSVRGSTEINKR